MYLVLVTLLTLYLGLSVFKIILPSSQHYALFVSTVVFLSALTAVKKSLSIDFAKKDFRFWCVLFVSLLMVATATYSGIYLTLNAERLETVQPFINDMDVLVGIIITITVLTLTLIHWGPMLTAFIALGVAYFFWGHLIEVPILSHPEYNKYFLLSYIGMSMTSGLFWLARLAADMIFFIIIFSNILRAAGMINLFVEIGKVTGRWITGGAAFPAVVGSGLSGMVTGEAISNVVLTGRFTIPTMMKYGFSPNFAGAVEASASSSGQIMPPIMGLSAFIMAAFLDISYTEVAKSALLPAILYVIGIVLAIMMVSWKLGMGRLEIPIEKNLIYRMLPVYVLSLGTVVGALLLYYSPNRAGLMGALVALVLFPLQGRYRPPLRESIRVFNGSYDMLISLCLLLIAIGPLTQSVITTNLSGRTAEFLSRVLPMDLPLLLAGAAVGCVFIGLGAPTPVAYIMTAIIIGPFLQQMGVFALGAHLFIFYFAAFSTLTPPVAPACLAAAKIAGGHYTKTGIEAMKIAAATLIIPFLFVMNQSLLEFPKISLETVYWFFFSVLVQFTMVLSMQGYFLRDLSNTERVIFFFIGLVGVYYALYHTVSLLVAYLVLMGGALLWVAKGRLVGGREVGLAGGDPKRGENEEIKEDE